MKWCSIDKDYISYLKKIEPRIPDIDYGTGVLKPFFSPLFKVGNLVYVTQVTSPKSRHLRIKDDLDFIKLFDKTKLIGVVNLNYMFPVPQELITNIEYSNLDSFKNFASENDKGKYISLLKKEMKEIKNKDLGNQAGQLYIQKYMYPDNRISKRCIDFRELEKEALSYKTK